MPALLEIPEVRQRISPLSVEEYHRLGEFNERAAARNCSEASLLRKCPNHFAEHNRLAAL